jgi:Ni,Fe-hydrogenase III large subunit
MSARGIIEAGAAETGRPWPRRVLGQQAWRDLAAALAGEDDIGLLALWADTQQVHALLLQPSPVLPLAVSVPVEGGAYPALSPARPVAAWFERMVRDLWGHRAEGAVDLRPWLDHGAWGSAHPMSPRPSAVTGSPDPPEFLPAAGDNLQQLALGPIEAGLANAAHLRLTGLGELTLRVEARLGYTHKGQMTLMRGKSPRAAARFAARLAGDATVAHAIAFARAAEAAAGVAVPPRAQALRAAMAELERISRHLADLGAVSSAAGYAPAASAAELLREALMQAAKAGFGHRMMMDCAVPGGVAVDLSDASAAPLRRALERIAEALPELADRCTKPAGLRDRLAGAGVVPPALAARFALGGVAGRASGRGFDARLIEEAGLYQSLGLAVPTRREGDALARQHIRLAEIAESARLARALLASLPEGPLTVALPTASGEGLGVAESFRGDVWYWLRLDGGLIASMFPADPSWRIWPALEAAAAAGETEDLPLCRLSLNPSVSGVDL